VLNQIRNRWIRSHREALIVLLLTALAFAVRVHKIDFYSLSEDESAKWDAIQEYRHGHFAGVNSEHPMLPKMLAWGSLAVGEGWNRVANLHHWSSLQPEGWLRLPNVAFGALTTGVLYLLCRRLMGTPGAFTAAYFWAISPLPIALNRLMKEETPLTFFTLLAVYFYCIAQQTDEYNRARRWYDLSAVGFGLALASQYILHLFGLNGLAWLLADKMGLTAERVHFSYRRFYTVMFISFILANPVILSPSNVQAIMNWLHHGGVRHSGYDFGGTLYLNFPSRFLAGVPWFYYAFLLLVKTPIPILAAIVLGCVLLVRNRRSLAFCYFASLGMVQLAGLSISGAKWIRYSLPLLPFLYLAGGYAVQQIWNLAQKRGVSLRVIAVPAVILLSVPLIGLESWAPYYSLYINPIGGGRQKITRYFAQDEVSEFDTREVAHLVCRFAPKDTTVATARPMSMAYYVRSCGRADLIVIALYDPDYEPKDGDLIVLEPSRRFLETQRYFDLLRDSGMLKSEVRVGPVLASTIYLFDSSEEGTRQRRERSTLAQLHRAPHGFDTHEPESASFMGTFSPPGIPRRSPQ